MNSIGQFQIRFSAILDKLSKHFGSWQAWLPARGNVLFTLLAVTILFFVQSGGAFGGLQAQVSEPTGSSGVIAYQGRLADSAGNPLTGTYPSIFRLYSANSGGVPLWEEQWTGPNSIAISDGLFNVMLGSLTPIPQELVANNANLWLGVTVGSDDEMTPRVQVGSVFYARQALSVPDASITAAKFAPGAIPPGVPVGSVVSWWRPSSSTPLPSNEWMIADGSVVTDSASPFFNQTLPNLTDKFIMGVSAANIGQLGGANSLNLAHSHTVNSHTHDVPWHVHNIDHDHETNDKYAVAGGSLSTHYDIYRTSGLNSGGWSGATSSSSPGTDVQLWSATDNRPAYVGLIYLVRIK